MGPSNLLATNPFQTRTDLATFAQSLLTSLLPHQSPLNARIHLGYTGTHFDETAALLEGFARPLWALAPLLAGGHDFPAAERWLKGMIAGTDPSGEEYWGEIEDKDQRMVEACCVGFWLAVIPDWIRERLSELEFEKVGKWLGNMNGKEMPATNWRWFRVMANLGLLACGSRYGSRAQMDADLDFMDTFYLGSGWSADGPKETMPTRQLDYYSSSFAIHYTGLVYSKLCAKSDPVRSERFRDRARRFSLDFVHYFAENGSAIPFGRSIVYRWAMGAFWAAVAFADLELPAPLEWGVVKGLLLRHLRWWGRWDGVWNVDGTLSIGYCYPNMHLMENYNSPGSVYWCCKVFAPLALPESHPFWISPELPYPTQSLPQTIALPHPGHTITHRGGHTFLLSSGQACSYFVGRGREKYGSMAYSSAFGFSVATGNLGLEQTSVAGNLALSDDGGEHWRIRRLPVDNGIDEATGVVWGTWKAWDDVVVKTWLVPPTEEKPLWHMRVHLLKTGRALVSADAGFAVYGQGGKFGRLLGEFDTATMQGQQSERGGAFVASEKGVCVVVDGDEGEGLRHGEAVRSDANSNLIHPRTLVPTLKEYHKAGDFVVLVTAIFTVPPPPTGSSISKDWHATYQEGPPKVPVDIINAAWESIRSGKHPGLQSTQ